jgi:hypothetical protein
MRIFLLILLIATLMCNRYEIVREQYGLNEIILIKSSHILHVDTLFTPEGGCVKIIEYKKKERPR